MDHKRTTGWGLSRNEAALLGAIIGYGILVVVVTPLLLGFLPILAIGWMLRVPVASATADSPTGGIHAAEPLSPVATSTDRPDPSRPRRSRVQGPRAPDDAGAPLARDARRPNLRPPSVATIQVPRMCVALLRASSPRTSTRRTPAVT